MFGGIIGIACWIGAFVMFMLFGALIAGNPIQLVWLVPVIYLTYRWLRRKYRRWEAAHSHPPRVTDMYPREWLQHSDAAKRAGLHAKYVAECKAANKAAHEELHEPMTMGGHNRGHHG